MLCRGRRRVQFKFKRSQPPSMSARTRVMTLLPVCWFTKRAE
jgi:hypothetical protein